APPANGVTIAELRRRAEAHGVATSYQDWRGQRVVVSEETLPAILAARGEPPDRAGQPPPAGQTPPAGRAAAGLRPGHEALAQATGPAPHGRARGVAL